MLSVLDIFRIGIGPSSSHTVGPMRIARRFVRALQKRGVAERTAAVLQAQYPGLCVVGTYSGSPTDEDWPAIQQRLAAAQPDLLFVAFGHPRQDLWIDRHRAELPACVAIGVGGAFDFVAGVRRRAPRWLQRLGLEWLHRLLHEPWRWRRMLKLPQFVFLVLVETMRRRLASRKDRA